MRSAVSGFLGVIVLLARPAVIDTSTCIQCHSSIRAKLPLSTPNSILMVFMLIPLLRVCAVTDTAVHAEALALSFPREHECGCRRSGPCWDSLCAWHLEGPWSSIRAAAVLPRKLCRIISASALQRAFLIPHPTDGCQSLRHSCRWSSGKAACKPAAANDLRAVRS